MINIPALSQLSSSMHDCTCLFSRIHRPGSVAQGALLHSNVVTSPEAETAHASWRARMSVLHTLYSGTGGWCSGGASVSRPAGIGFSFGVYCTSCTSFLTAVGRECGSTVAA
jgi:hypothetical protein